jgi:hypothetical protein
MAKIPDLDAWLLELVEGLEPGPHRFEFQCHPDVYIAIRDAADLPYREPVSGEGSPAFGGADVVVKPELGSGHWELYEYGQRIKSGHLGKSLYECWHEAGGGTSNFDLGKLRDLVSLHGPFLRSSGEVEKVPDFMTDFIPGPGTGPG